MCNSVVPATFIRDFLQMKLFQTSKSIFSRSFGAIIPKLSGYVIDMEMKKLVQWNFDLGL